MMLWKLKSRRRKNVKKNNGLKFDFNLSDIISGNRQAAKEGESEHSGKQAERALAAANVINELMKTPESNIPDELMERAHAVAVIPNIVKGAFTCGRKFRKRYCFQANE